MSVKPKACGCHIYSGAFTVGMLEKFDVVGQWEEITAGAKTFDLNFPDIHHPLNRSDWPIDDMRGQIEVFYANPPCAVWSMAGAKLGLADPRLAFTATAMDTALQVSPEYFLLESVPRAWSPNGGRDYYTDWARKFQRQGYAVTIVLTNAVLHGAAQNRERFHFIAHRLALPLRTPEVLPTEVRTVRHAIHDLENNVGEFDENHPVRVLKQAEKNIMRRMKQGSSWGDAYEQAVRDGVQAKKHRVIAGRLRYDAPSSTVLDIGAMVHPEQDRFLTLREGARLCGYPDWFKFIPVPAHQGGNFSEVSQAVIPPMGAFWGNIFSRGLDLSDEPEQGRGPESELRVIDWRPLGKPYSPRLYKQTLRDWQVARTTRA